jgi:galactokinase/mevalonate kinase-like predicted kinase
MPYKLTLPARINVLGNPSDANEGDFATLSAAVNLFAGAYVDNHDQLVIEQLKQSIDNYEILSTQRFERTGIPLPYNGELDLCKAAVNRLYSYSPELREKMKAKGMRIATWTEVPRQSGLGGSTLFVLMTLAGLRVIYNLDPLVHNDYVLAELTQRVEAKELGHACGYADRYVPLFGGLAYLDYRGKLYQEKINTEPYATYEKLDPWAKGLPLVAICSGVQRDSGDVHGRMRPIYLREHDAWIHTGGETPEMVRFMEGVYETAWRGKIALLQRDWATFGELMNQNHHLVDKMMTYCSFPDGAGEINNLLIETALSHGALGAKLTGAGGGGSVFALTYPGEEEALMEVWRGVAAKAGLIEAQVYRPRIVQHGLIVEETKKLGIPAITMVDE